MERENQISEILNLIYPIYSDSNLLKDSVSFIVELYPEFYLENEKEMLFQIIKKILDFSVPTVNGKMRFKEDALIASAIQISAEKMYPNISNMISRYGYRKNFNDSLPIVKHSKHIINLVIRTAQSKTKNILDMNGTGKTLRLYRGYKNDWKFSPENDWYKDGKFIFRESPLSSWTNCFNALSGQILLFVAMFQRILLYVQRIFFLLMKIISYPYLQIWKRISYEKL